MDTGEEMDRPLIPFLLLAGVSIAVGAVYINRLEVFLTALLTALVFGCISPLIAARRLYFLAAEASHMALLSASLSIVLANESHLKSELVWAIALGLALIYAVGFAIQRGMNPDVVTSIATAATVSGSVMAMYIVLTRYRVGYSLWSVILGDPLLVTRRDLVVLSSLSLLVLTIAISVYSVIIYLGVDRDSAVLIFRNIWIYEYLFFTALGIASIAMLKIVGYVLEHVLLLLPALVAINVVEGGRNVMVSSICISIASTMLGFSLSLAVNIAPASAVGFIALAAFILSLAIKRLGLYG